MSEYYNNLIFCGFYERCESSNNGFGKICFRALTPAVKVDAKQKGLAIVSYSECPDCYVAPEQHILSPEFY